MWVMAESSKSGAAKPAVKADTPQEKPAEKTRPAGECVVSDGTPHTGRAVNGMVCSAHANRYYADGTPR